MKTTKTSKASAAMWDRAHQRINAESGIGDPRDALHEIPTIKALLAQINSNPDALGLLAERQHELTPEQRTAAIRAGLPSKAHKPKVAKATPRATTPTTRRLADIPLRGYR